MADFPQQFNAERIWQKSKAVKFTLFAPEASSELNPSAITQAKNPIEVH